VLARYTRSITERFTRTHSFTYGQQNFEDYMLDLFTHLYEHREFGRVLLDNHLLYIVEDVFDENFLNASPSDRNLYQQMFIAGGFFSVYRM
jgi:hypothetical protein